MKRRRRRKRRSDTGEEGGYPELAHLNANRKLNFFLDFVFKTNFLMQTKSAMEERRLVPFSNRARRAILLCCARSIMFLFIPIIYLFILVLHLKLEQDVRPDEGYKDLGTGTSARECPPNDQSILNSRI